jgi:hypothetical protein
MKVGGPGCLPGPLASPGPALPAWAAFWRRVPQGWGQIPGSGGYIWGFSTALGGPLGREGQIGPALRFRVKLIFSKELISFRKR